MQTQSGIKWHNGQLPWSKSTTLSAIAGTNVLHVAAEAGSDRWFAFCNGLRVIGRNDGRLWFDSSARACAEAEHAIKRPWFKLPLHVERSFLVMLLEERTAPSKAANDNAQNEVIR